jgi:hypothetical protein
MYLYVMITKKLMDGRAKKKIPRKTLIVLAVVFSVGFAAGILTEHIVHGIQAKSAKNSAGGHRDHCADGHMDEACPEH